MLKGVEAIPVYRRRKTLANESQPASLISFLI